MAGTDFLHIPPQIRREYIPFQFQSGKYSFKKKDGTNLIYPFSANLDKFFANDSFLPNSISYSDFIDLIPTVQIREYQPDARLTQTMKWFSYFKKGLDAGMKSAGGEGSLSWGEIKKTATDAIEKMNAALKTLTSGEASVLNDIGSLADYTDLLGKGGTAPGAVLTVPWILYYQLNTTTTTNVYEIPALWNTGDALFKSNGHYGYKTASQISLAQMLGMSNNGNAIQTILNNAGLNEIKIHRMPVFDPDEGFQTDDINVTFTLVNDSVEAAANNFIFLHNLVGQNRWVQYGFVQASASVYDVVIPGANRYWMCSGSFTATPKGILRVPSNAVKTAINSKGISAKRNEEHINTLRGESEAAAAAEANKLDAIIENSHSEIETSNENISNNNDSIKSHQSDKDSANECLNRPVSGKEGYYYNSSGEEISKADIDKQIADADAEIQKAEASNAEAQAKIMECNKKMQDAQDRLNQMSRAAVNLHQESINEYGTNVNYMLEKIKIPDAYEVKLNFKPLLPDNFNNFLYGWRAGRDWDIMKGTKTDPGANGNQRDWVFEEMVQKIVEAFGG